MAQPAFVYEAIRTCEDEKNRILNEGHDKQRREIEAENAKVKDKDRSG